MSHGQNDPGLVVTDQATGRSVPVDVDRLLPTKDDTSAGILQDILDALTVQNRLLLALVRVEDRAADLSDYQDDLKPPLEET
jgi:hypothetical protein